MSAFHKFAPAPVSCTTQMLSGWTGSFSSISVSACGLYLFVYLLKQEFRSSSLWWSLETVLHGYHLGKLISIVINATKGAKGLLVRTDSGRSTAWNLVPRDVGAQFSNHSAWGWGAFPVFLPCQGWITISPMGETDMTLHKKPQWGKWYPPGVVSCQENSVSVLGGERKLKPHLPVCSVPVQLRPPHTPGNWIPSRKLTAHIWQEILMVDGTWCKDCNMSHPETDTQGLSVHKPRDSSNATIVLLTNKFLDCCY